MFLTFIDQEGHVVDIKVTDIAMRREQRGTYIPYEGATPQYLVGTNITLTSGAEVWVTLPIEEVRLLMGEKAEIWDAERTEISRMGSPSHTAFTCKVRGTGK